MGLFDILALGGDKALGVSVPFDQYRADDMNNMKLLNEETSRIEEATRSAAARMERVQLQTGAGVNRKLQQYYDGLTEELKQVISKNPNYKTDAFQMQQVNSVMGKFSNNEIIANDEISKGSYAQFRDAAVKGVLTAREIREAEDRWKQYQDGLIPTFDYTKAKLVDYHDDAIKTMGQIARLSLSKKGLMQVSRSDARNGMEGLMMGNSDYADKAINDFRTSLDVQEQAKWLGIPVKKHLTAEDEQELKGTVSKRIAMLSKNKSLANPIVDWLTDTYYPYTHQQFDQRYLANLHASHRASRSKTEKIKPDGYFKRDLYPALQNVISHLDSHPNARSVSFNVKMNGARALVPEDARGLLVSDRMFIHTTDGRLVRIQRQSTGYLQPYQNKSGVTHYDGAVIGGRYKGKVFARAAVKTYGSVVDEDYENFVTSLGFHVVSANGATSIYSDGKRVRHYPMSKEKGIAKFMVEMLGAHYEPKQTGGQGGMVYTPSKMIVPYDAESAPFDGDPAMERMYDEEVYMRKKKYQLEADAQWQPSGMSGMSGAAEQGGYFSNVSY